MEDGILLLGSRVVVPQPAHDTVMEEAHLAHTAIIRMNLTHQFMCWPKLILI